MADDAGAATEVAAEEAEEKEQEAATGGDAFDADRAMATIKKQRESEAAAIQKAKDLEAELAKYRTAEEAKAEEAKTLEQKVAERDQALKAKDAEIADLHVRFSFIQEAAALGIADPGLAFLAAKEQGLLGTFNPKEGTVSDHGFDKLAEKYPSFAATEDSPTAKAGDAGARGKGATQGPGDQFNQAVREAFRGRR